jgi:hypothetical protein
MYVDYKLFLHIVTDRILLLRFCWPLLIIFASFFSQNKTSESPALCLTIFLLTENFQEKMLDEEFKRLQFVLV